MSDSHPPPTPLTAHRVLAARGPDARKFLQGQLSQEILTLAVGEARRASLNTPQGRCLVILEVIAETDSDVLCITTAAQAPTLLETLKRYVLRSKVRLEDETAHYVLTGHWSPTSVGSTTPTLRGCASFDGRRIHLQRVHTIATPATPATSDSPEASDAPTPPRTDAPSRDPTGIEAWQRADLAVGLPQLEPRTQGEFVAQMLNLDVLEAISFKKGCYTGQEVIARAHFRGRVKRRLQRFRLDLPADEILAPGQSITLSDGRSASVVNALPEIGPDDESRSMRDPTRPESGAPRLQSWQCLAVTTFDGEALPEALPLPYALPS